jgi:threonine synthase
LSALAVRCRGCGAVPRIGDPYGWSCPERTPGDGIDHVMVRHVELAGLSLVTSDSENPFVRYRGLLSSYHRWRDAGRDDASFVALVEELDAAVAAVDGHGLRRTPLARHDPLDAATGMRVWVKDETGNVAGSHKGRHLFGLIVTLRVLERLGLLSREQAGAPLAIASCGNAALAAAVVAAAAGRRLEVFIPTDADPVVVARLGELGASTTVCDRDAVPIGDPCYRRFLDAVAAGAVPFGCQGPDNGLTIEGGATLGWELAESLADAGTVLDRLVVQVGGGALATACLQGLEEAVGLGVLDALPVFDTVQTAGAAPLARAHRLIADRIGGGMSPGDALGDAAAYRSRYMWPWETVPASVAHGILDDETYDWLAVLRGMIETGGSSVVASEDVLREANDLARRATGIPVDHTGSAGLAGLLVAARAGIVAPGSAVAVVFSGRAR